MQTNEGRQFMTEMTLDSGRAQLRIEGRTGCNCGCGKPARVEISVQGQTVAVRDPVFIDAAIRTLQEARRNLWGDP